MTSFVFLLTTDGIDDGVCSTYPIGQFPHILVDVLEVEHLLDVFRDEPNILGLVEEVAHIGAQGVVVDFL